MQRLIFVLSVSLGSVAAGYLLRRSVLDRYVRSPEKISHVSKDLKLAAMFVLNPVPIISSFWGFQLEHTSLLFFPLLGVLCTSLGGAAALLINTVFRIPPKQAASVFTSGMFSNILTFGGLTAFVFLGIEGYVLIQLFNMLITPMYYLVGFPISEQVSLGQRRFRLSFSLIRERPYLMIPAVSVLTGIALNLSGLGRPQFLLSITSMLIPLVVGALGFSIGITLFVGKIGRYTREILLIAAVKFGISPLVMTAIGLLMGLHTMNGGLPFKVLVISSAMPVAFNSLIPPALYGFDLDLANSAWVVTTFSYIVVLPILYLSLQM